mgnify:CR=1 FL=1
MIVETDRWTTLASIATFDEAMVATVARDIVTIIALFARIYPTITAYLHFAAIAINIVSRCAYTTANPTCCRGIDNAGETVRVSRTAAHAQPARYVQDHPIS